MSDEDNSNNNNNNDSKTDEGLTDDEYDTLQEDIERTRVESNRKHDFSGGNGNGNGGANDPNQNQKQNQKLIENDQPINPSVDLDPYITDRDYAEYYIRTVKKTVRREDSFVRQVFYTVLSKDSDDPLNLAVLAKTSAGKTYGITETLQYFSDKGIWKIGSMTPKVIVRQNGLLVDSDYKPLKPKLKDLKKELREDEGKKNSAEVERIEEEIDALKEDARVLIELTGKCLVFLEPPHTDTWNILKTTLSHDQYEIEHPYVYEVPGMGFVVKKIITRGWPSCIFASARDESRWAIWPEIQSRFLVISPNIIPEKIHEGNILTGQKKSLPSRIKSKIIVSPYEKDLARKCSSYLIQIVKANMVQDPNIQSAPFWIPYGLILGLALPSEKGTDNRITNRIFSFLRIISLARNHLRCRLQYFDENLIIPNISDLHETLHTIQNVSGIPDYKLSMFKDHYNRCFNKKKEWQNGQPDVSYDGKRQEQVFGLTNKEFCEYYKEQTGKVLSTKTFRETYIEEWYANGLIETVDSVVNAKQHISYPIISFIDSETEVKTSTSAYGLESVFKIGAIGVSVPSPMDIPPKPITIQDNFKEIPKDWLKLQISGLLQWTFQLGQESREVVYASARELSKVFRIYDENRERICLCQFLSSYGYAYDLNAYFFNGPSYKKPEKIPISPKFSYGHGPDDCNSIDDCLKTPITSILNTQDPQKVEADAQASDQSDRVGEEDKEKKEAEADPNGSRPDQSEPEPESEPSPYSRSVYEHLIVTEDMPASGKTAFRCKEHPDKWDTDLKGLEISHFEPFHHIDTDPGNVHQ